MEAEAMTLQTELARIVEAEREHERRRATLRPRRRSRTRSSGRRFAGAIAAILGVARRGSRSARAPYPLER
jgi:hypothetical protein